MVTDTSTTAPEQPAELCGYAVVDTLAPGASYFAIGPGGRGVVLKKLDPDCLHAGLLHPDVRDRLSRVRELAHAGAANLFGVGKDGGEAWLIWEYAEGKPIADHARDHVRGPREMAVLVRELVHTVESLHRQGIVHGAIHGGNVIVAPDGSIRLTHISPLLYVDPSDDADAIEELVGQLLEQRGERVGALGRLLGEARASKLPLRGLAARLAALAEPRVGGAAAPLPAAAVAREERRTRKRAVYGALLAAAAGITVAYAVWLRAGQPGAEYIPAWLTGW